MQYAQFFNMSTGYIDGSIPPQFDDAHKKPIEACGSDGVLTLDARCSPQFKHDVSAVTCKSRGFVGYRIYQGANFSSATPISEYCGLK